MSAYEKFKLSEICFQGHTICNVHTSVHLRGTVTGYKTP